MVFWTGCSCCRIVEIALSVDMTDGRITKGKVGRATLVFGRSAISQGMFK